MLNYLDIGQLLVPVLPFQLEKEELDGLLLQSSYVVFSQKNEELFMKGDAAKGFYWLLQGKARFKINNSDSFILQSGDFIGLDNFVSGVAHKEDILTDTKDVVALFIGSLCYKEQFSQNGNLIKHAFHQLVQQLMKLKNLNRQA